MLPDHLRKGLKELERWVGIAYEQEAGRMLLRRFYGQCLAISSELGGMRHHLGWGHPRFLSQGAPVSRDDDRLALPWDHPLFIYRWGGGGYGKASLAQAGRALETGLEQRVTSTDRRGSSAMTLPFQFFRQACGGWAVIWSGLDILFCCIPFPHGALGGPKLDTPSTAVGKAVLG